MTARQTVNLSAFDPAAAAAKESKRIHDVPVKLSEKIITITIAGKQATRGQKYGMPSHAFALHAVKDQMEKALQARQKHTPKHLNLTRLPVLARLGCCRGWGRVLTSTIPSSPPSIFAVVQRVEERSF